MLKIQPKWLIAIVILSTIALLAGCGSRAANGSETKKKEIHFGFAAGPYLDQVKRGIQPYLEKKGYTVKITELGADLLSPSLAKGEVDATVGSSTAYLETILNKEKKFDLAVLSLVPSAPLGLYSDKYKTKEEVKDGLKVGVPNDPVNLERSLKVIEKLGWAKLKDGYDPASISERDIVPLSLKLTYVPLPSAQLPRSLQDLDYGFLFGNYALDSGRKLTDALALEETPKEHFVIAAIQAKNKTEQWVKDIQEAYRSKEFKQFITSDPKYKGFVLPDYLK